MTTLLTILPASARRMYRGRFFHKSMTPKEALARAEQIAQLEACNLSGVQQAQLAEQLQAQRAQEIVPGAQWIW